ncbi:MAG: copper resistance protein CopC [Pseudomonadota bacterium]|nr:copper resistance protein CopC [Pseudomonadota bacterium]
MQPKPHHLAPWLFAAAIASACAHGIVETASPKNGATLSTPPSEIRLKFSEPLEPAFTSVRLFSSSGREVATTEKARIEEGKTVVLPLPTLAPGAYKAQWRSVGHDGHPVHGELTFTVK